MSLYTRVGTSSIHSQNHGVFIEVAQELMIKASLIQYSLART